MKHLAVVFAVLYAGMFWACSRGETPRHVYVVSPGIDIAAVSVFNCGNIAFESRREAEKYSRERPGTHVFEVSFTEIR